MRDETYSIGSQGACMGPTSGKLQEDSGISDHYREGSPDSHAILRPNGLPVR